MCGNFMQSIVIMSIPVICCQVCYPHLVCHLLGIPFRPPAGPGLPTNAHFFLVPLIYLEVQEKKLKSKRRYCVCDQTCFKGEGSIKEATKQSTSASNSTKTDNPFLRTTRTPRNVLPGAQLARRMV